jgi:IS30 family transposase
MLKLNLPDTPARKTSKAKKKIEELLSDIEAAQEKGFSSDQIAESLKEHGVTISGSTLRSYIYRIRIKRKRELSSDDKKSSVLPEKPRTFTMRKGPIS